MTNLDTSYTVALITALAVAFTVVFVALLRAIGVQSLFG